MNQAEMRKKICPIISPRPQATIGRGLYVMCQGDNCVAFNSRPTKIFLAEDGKDETIYSSKVLKLTDRSGIVGGAPANAVDQTSEINLHIASGWKREGQGTNVYFTKPGEPSCWCDAMAGNAQCGYEAP